MEKINLPAAKAPKGLRSFPTDFQKKMELFFFNV
jgi:hypothetical protein